QDGLPRSECSEPSSFLAINVRKHLDAGNRCGFSPKICSLPSWGKPTGLVEEDVGSYQSRALGHQTGQFPDTGTGAWTVRMSYHHQRAKFFGWSHQALGRPTIRRAGLNARSLGVIPYQPKASPYRSDP